MDLDVREIVQAIHDTPTKVVLAAAGAGTTGLSDLLLIGGASRTLLEAIVPYSTAAFDEFLGGRAPAQYVSSRAARRLAGCAFTRAAKLTRTQHDASFPLLGLACTAALSTDRTRRGDHRVHIAAWQSGTLVEQTLLLTKGARNRDEEERLYSRLLLNALAEACGVEQVLDLGLIGDETVSVERYNYRAAAEALRQNELDFFALYDHGEIRTQPAKDGAAVHPQTLLSGSFNPLHQGHLGMAAAASKLLERPVAFELSALNVDKPPLPVEVVVDRLAQFAGAHSIYVSNAPTYLEKSRLYPDATFIVGHDTAERLFYPKYYDNSESNMLQALGEIAERGCHFLVTGRVDADGAFRTLADLAIPAAYRKLFQPIPEEAFRLDISSSELRGR